METINTINITSSREVLRKRLLEEYAKILSVDEKQLDQSDTAFNTYIQNVQSYLIADLLFLASIVYRESNAITANLLESIQNWATYLGYAPRKAIPAKVSVLVQIDVSQPFTATIPFNHRFQAVGNIPFRSTKQYEISVLADGTKRILAQDSEGNVTNIAFSLDTINNKTYMSFLVDCEQYDIQEDQFVVPELKPYEYYSKTITLDTDDHIVGVDVYVREDTTETKWKEKKIILAQPNEPCYELVVHKDNIELLFGNGFFGRQPKGTVRVVLKLTKGSKGNVMPGSIVTGDPLYSEFAIKYLVTNVERAEGGQDYESIDEIRQNSINSIKTLNRIVSEEDFINAPSILHCESELTSRPILKRSDLACNDIYLYTIVRHNNQICLTHTIPIQVPPVSVSYPPFETFEYEGRYWICPFSIEVDHLTKTLKFVYVKTYQSYILRETYSRPNAQSFVSKMEQFYERDNDIFEFHTYVVSLAQNLRVDAKLKLITTTCTTLYSKESVETINYNVFKYIFRVPRQDMLSASKISLQVEVYTDEGSGFILDRVYRTDAEPISSLDITYSPIVTIDGTECGLDVPVFEKEYWESLTNNDRTKLVLDVIDKFAVGVERYDVRMLNTHISSKFVKTLGKTTNTRFTTPDYHVLGVYNTSSNLPNPQDVPGEYVALSQITDPSDPFFQFTGHIVMSDGQQWQGIHVGRGTVVKDPDGNVYVTDGVRWIQPYYDLPLKFIVEVHTNSPSSELMHQCKDIIKEYVNSLGIEESLYLSQIVDRLHNLTDVRYCRIIQPATDIIYRDIMQNLTKADLYTYTPEKLWTRDEDIEILLITG